MPDNERQQPVDREELEEAVTEVEEVGSADDGEAEPEGNAEEQQDTPRRERRQRGGRGARVGASALAAPSEPPPAPRLYEQFRANIIPAMMQEFSYGNTMEVPRLQKIVLNIGVGEALTNGRAMEAASADLAVIAGQKPIVTRARKSITYC